MGESVGRRPDERPQRGNMTDRSIPSTSSLIIPSPTLQKILDGREYFFHAEQQTGKMLDDNKRRARLSRDLQRRAAITFVTEKGGSIAYIRQTPVIVDQYTVTLTLQYNSSDYYQLTNPKKFYTSTTRKLDSLSSISVETDTVVRLPDREESDKFLAGQITITGRLADVEEARLRIRDCATFDLTFPLQDELMDMKFNTKESIVEYLVSKSIGSFVPDHLLIQVLDGFNFFYRPFVIRIVARESAHADVEQFIPKILEVFYPKEVHPSIPWASELVIPSCHRSLIFGNTSGCNVISISKISNTTIHFPWTVHEETSCCVITGSLSGVICARKLFVGIFPLQLIFTAKDTDLQYKIETDELYKHFDATTQVYLSVQRSDLQPSMKVPNDPHIHYFKMSCREYNIRQLYQVYDMTVKSKEVSRMKPNVMDPLFKTLAPNLNNPETFLDYKNPYDPKYSTSDLSSDDTKIYECDDIVRDLEKENILHSEYYREDTDIVTHTEFSYSKRPSRDGYSYYSPMNRHRSYNNREYSGSKFGRSGGLRSRHVSGDKKSGFYLRPNPRVVDSYSHPMKSELSLKPKATKEDGDVYYALNDSTTTAMNQSIDVNDKSKRRYPDDSNNRLLNTKNFYRRSHEDKVHLRIRSPLLAPRDDLTFTDVSSFQTDTPPSPSEEIARRRINVMELIQKASEEPQSLVRAREMKETVDTDDSFDDRPHRTYAEILEGKRCNLSPSRSVNTPYNGPHVSDDFYRPQFPRREHKDTISS